LRNNGVLTRSYTVTDGSKECACQAVKRASQKLQQIDANRDSEAISGNDDSLR
jgi:hypothetical protein